MKMNYLFILLIFVLLTPSAKAHMLKDAFAPEVIVPFGDLQIKIDNLEMALLRRTQNKKTTNTFFVRVDYLKKSPLSLQNKPQGEIRFHIFLSDASIYSADCSISYFEKNQVLQINDCKSENARVSDKIIPAGELATPGSYYSPNKNDDSF